MNLLFLLLDSSVMDFALTVTVVGFGIVIVALTLLSFLFSKMPKLINMRMKKKKKQAASVLPSKVLDDEIEGNVTAAISYAMHLYFDELHDEESNILTIKKVRRVYSPWSSKIYSVTHNWPNG